MRKTKSEMLYDESVKEFLSQKIILAHILVYSVKEFKGMNPKDVVLLIEGEPEVTKRQVYPNGTQIQDFVSGRIHGRKNEDVSAEERRIYYDIIFTVYVPSGKEQVKLIVNIEAQNQFYRGYNLTTRGVYYGARMLSSQKEVEFTGSNYQDIKKVYSIWICTDCPKDMENTITEYSIKQTNVVGDAKDRGGYDLQVCNAPSRTFGGRSSEAL